MAKFFKHILFSFIFLSLIGFDASSQIVKGYFPYYRSVAQAGAVNYSQLTDVVYAFAQLDGSGNLTIMGGATFNEVKARCASNGVRLWVAIGGWGLSGNFSGVASNVTSRTTLANACRTLCTTHGLAGIDIDWEFPGAGDKANYTAMLAAIKGQLGATYKLSAALGGESFTYSCVNQGHAVGVEAAAFTHLDYFNIMSYDAPTCFANHTSLDFMQRSMAGWNALGCPYNKMLPGIAFYGRPDPDNHLWSTVASATHFNDADGIVSGFGYDTKPTIEAKVNYAMCTMGAPGVMIWEISQDAPTGNAYALLPVVKTAASACGGPTCTLPDINLGADASICGVSSITLNSGLTTNAPTRLFTWKKDGVNVVTNSTTAATYSATSAGTYEVIVTEGASCTKSDIIVVTATLQNPALGTDKIICNPSVYNLSPTNLSSFPASTTWQWSFGGAPITGATNSSLNDVRKAGTYRLTASVSGCSSTFDELTLTSSLPTPVDGCRNGTGTVSLSVTNPGLGAGPYTWYTAGGASIGSGTTITSPVISATTTYYVQDGAAGATGIVGKPDNTGGWNGSSFASEKIVFNVMQALTISSVRVYPSAAGATVTIRVLQSDGTTIVDQATFTGVGAGAQTLNVDLSVPVGTGYLMDAVGTSGMLSYGSAFTYPSTLAGVISITGQSPAWTEGDRYNYIFNWTVSSGSSCARLPVIAQVGGCSSLPVTFSAFDVEDKGADVFLSWATSSELNNDYFEIEKSYNGKHFEMAGRVDGAGNSNSEIQYSFSDRETGGSGTIYYRIAQYDRDGTRTCTEVKSITRTIAHLVSVAPNPFYDATELFLFNVKHTKITVRITDATGSLVVSEEAICEEGKLKIGRDLEPGVYIVHVIAENEISTVRIVKLQ